MNKFQISKWIVSKHSSVNSKIGYPLHMCTRYSNLTQYDILLVEEHSFSLMARPGADYFETITITITITMRRLRLRLRIEFLI